MFYNLKTTFPRSQISKFRNSLQTGSTVRLCRAFLSILSKYLLTEAGCLPIAIDIMIIYVDITFRRSRYILQFQSIVAMQGSNNYTCQPSATATSVRSVRIPIKIKCL